MANYWQVHDLTYSSRIKEGTTEAMTAELSIVSPAFTNHKVTLRLESVSVSQALCLLARVKAISFKLEKANWFCKVAWSPSMDNQTPQTHTQQRSDKWKADGSIPKIPSPTAYLQYVHLCTVPSFPFCFPSTVSLSIFISDALSAITSHTKVISISTLDQQRLLHSSESVTNAEWSHPYLEGLWRLQVVLYVVYHLSPAHTVFSLQSQAGGHCITNTAALPLGGEDL